MTSEYKRAMDGLALTEYERGALTEKLVMLEQEARDAGRALRPGEPTAPVRVPRARARRGGKGRLRLAAVAAVVAVAAGLGGAAYASGAYLGVGQVIDDLFNGPPANTEIVDKIGRPIGASASDGGVTVTAEAVIGDARSYTVVYSIARDDGEPFDVPGRMTGESALPLTFERSDSALDVMTQGSYGSSWFYDADPDDPAIQFVEQVSIDAARSGSVAGATMNVDLKNLQYIDGGGRAHTLVSGRWHMKFKMSYEDASVALPAGGTFDLNGMTATVAELSVSPVSLSIAYSVDAEAPELASGSGRMGDEDADAIDRFLGVGDVALCFADGTVVPIADDGGGVIESGMSALVRKVIVFDRVVDVDDLVAVELGGMTAAL